MHLLYMPYSTHLMKENSSKSLMALRGRGCGDARAPGTGDDAPIVGSFPPATAAAPPPPVSVEFLALRFPAPLPAPLLLLSDTRKVVALWGAPGAGGGAKPGHVAAAAARAASPGWLGLLGALPLAPFAPAAPPAGAVAVGEGPPRSGVATRALPDAAEVTSRD